MTGVVTSVTDDGKTYDKVFYLTTTSVAEGTELVLEEIPSLHMWPA